MNTRLEWAFRQDAFDRATKKGREDLDGFPTGVDTFVDTHDELIAAGGECATIYREFELEELVD